MLDRRTFVAGLGAGIAGAVAPSARAQPESGDAVVRRMARPRRPLEPITRIRLALKYGMIGEGSTVAEKFAIARECGFDGVEMDSPNGLDNEEVIRAKEETGIEIPGVVDSVHWSKTLADPDPRVRSEGRAALETALSDCKDYGGTSVLLVPAVVSDRVPYDVAYERSKEEVRRVLPYAEDLKVSIVIENVWNNFLLSPLEARRYVDETGRARVGDGDWTYWVATEESDRRTVRYAQRVLGWHFDIGNIVNYGWPEQWIRILGDRILKLDVKEFSRKKRNDEGLWKGFAVEIGEGDIDWAAVREALVEIGYNGWAAAEVGGGDRARLTDVATRMDRVLNEGRE